MMQFNMYHHYTVDEHLLRCIGVLAEIERGDGATTASAVAFADAGPRSSSREALYVAVLLHDIAKGRPEDHSDRRRAASRGASARIWGCRRPTPKPSPGWSRTISLMSMTAQTRDLNDRKTIEDFAAVVQSLERLKLLLILTVCDIRGVGPGVWNGWKGQLLRTLYYETELLLTGGFSEVSRAERAAAARERAGRGAGRLAAGRSARAMSALHYDNYLLTVDLRGPAAPCATSSARPMRPERQLATMVKTAPVRGGHRDHRARAGPSAPAVGHRRRLRRRRAATSSTRRSSRPRTAARSTPS